MLCPVCKNEANEEGTSDYGERTHVSCPRCGIFVITRTAASMLESRLKKDELSRARLSHAIRMEPQNENEEFTITSANLDTLASKSLPDIKQQLNLLLQFVSSNVGDDYLKCIGFPDYENMAGLLGAVDKQRVSRLIQHAIDIKMLETCAHEPGKIRISPTGHELIKAIPNSSNTEEAIRNKQGSQGDDEITQSFCNICKRINNSFVRKKFTKYGEDGPISWSDTFETVECCGCGYVSVRHTQWFSEWDEFLSDQITGEQIYIPGKKIHIWPSPSTRDKPDWVDQLYDASLRDIMDEIYVLIDQNKFILASIGTRTLLDRAMYLAIGDKPGGFPGKINAIVADGRIGEKEKDIFLVITDVGNASAHRGFSPDKNTFHKVLSVVEAFLHREFIAPKVALEIRETTPKRDQR